MPLSDANSTNEVDGTFYDAINLKFQEERIRLQVKAAIRHIFHSLVRNFRPLLIYHFFVSLLAIVVLVPISTWIMTRVLSRTGIPLISPEEMLGFFLSPTGVAWVLTGGSLGLLLIFVIHAGMILIAAETENGHYRVAITALWQVIRKLPRLLLLSVLQIGAHLLIAAPFLLAVVIAWSIMLKPYDPYYLVSETPRVFWVFLIVCAPFVAGILFFNGWLYLRWVLAFPVLLLERKSPKEALKRSAQLTRGSFRKITALILAMAFMVLLIPALLIVIFDTLGGWFLGWVPENFMILIPAVMIYLILYIILAVLLSFLGNAANSLFIQHLYQSIAGVRPALENETPPAHTGALAWGVEVILLIFAVSQAVFVLYTFFDFQDDVAIVAHRGSSMMAPENTMPAIELALEEGADYVEIDVRETADGALVLLHDRDLRRIAGDSRNIWELTLEEVREIDAGNWFHPRFSGVGIPTLEEVIDVVQGQARLYLEIKPSPATPDLTRNVVTLLQEKEFIDDVLIGAMEPGVLRDVKRLEPELRTALFVHTAIGRPDRDILDVLALRAAITTGQDIRNAHRHGHELHIWTVNDRREMSRFIDMGVDSIITDDPGMLTELLQERAALSNPSLFLVKLRHWLRS